MQPHPVGLFLRLAEGLRRAVLPFPCLGCGAPLPSRRPRLGLCPLCQGRLRPMPSVRCARCGRPLRMASPVSGFLCGRCRRRPSAVDRVLYGWHYLSPLTEVLRGFKFQGLDFLGEELATELVRHLAGELPPDSGPVVPMPLSWRRRLGRGYNQAALVARPLARVLGLDFSSLLRRRHRPRQSSLPRRARRRNQRGSFRLRGRPPRGARLLLIDDIMTTGATIEAAARCLKQGGAEEVWAVVVARTPEPGELYVAPRGAVDR